MINVVARCAHGFSARQSRTLTAPDLSFFSHLFHPPACPLGLLRSIEELKRIVCVRCLAFRPLSSVAPFWIIFRGLLNLAELGLNDRRAAYLVYDISLSQ